MLKKEEQYSYNFIDLFAGAGGLSEGFLQAGFKPVAHVEMNKFAAKTLEKSKAQQKRNRHSFDSRRNNSR